jgi:twitching motility protein PilT
VPDRPAAAPPPRDSRAESWLLEILEKAADVGAADIHIHSGATVKLRRYSRLVEFTDEPLEPTEAEAALHSILSAEQYQTLHDDGQVDFAYEAPDIGRYRANIYLQHRGLDAVFHRIPSTPPTLEELGLPSELAKVTNFHQGLVLVTGPTGCGKSTTLAALVDIINAERRDHILTVEDPIEIVHRSNRCLVNQRQVEKHTESFARALRGALREDPDVICIGEMRDLETISLALSAAETGHLVLATVHTNSAIRTINRLVGAYPPAQQSQVRTMLSESLRAVISQRLLPTTSGEGVALALEILHVTKAVGNLIRENRAFRIHSILQTGAAHGMRLMDASLARLLKEGRISREVALANTDNPNSFS